MKFSTAMTLLLVMTADMYGQDVIFRRKGQTSTGKVTRIQPPFLRVEVPLAPNQPHAVVSIPLVDIDHVDFGETEAVEKYLGKITGDQLQDIEKLWMQRLSLLELPESTAGAFALKLGDLLMESELERNHRAALKLFQRIEAKDWSEKRRMRARKGRLRAMVKLGRAEEAADEAERLAVSSEDPELLIEAKYVLAQTSKRRLERLVEDNPRWIEDDEVRPERDRLFNETLDLFLFPHLFHGARTREAARGLWGAIGVYEAAGETEQALGRAEDLIAIYPETSFARDAEKLIQKQKKGSATES
jgi:tetratricopeptide (TPR) repeat protein